MKTVIVFKIFLFFFLVGCKKNAPIDDHQIYKTQKDLQYLAMCVDAYVVQNGKMPDSLFSATLEFKGQIPENWKKIGRAVDTWGAPYKISKTSKGFQISSFGKNRLDENGSGDDIVINKYVIIEEQTE